jgi:hypothetical protein
MVLIFCIVLGILLLLLAKETVLLIGAILELAVLLVKVVVHLVALMVIGIHEVYRVAQSRHVVNQQRPIRAQRAPSHDSIMLIDRGDGTYVPSRGEW